MTDKKNSLLAASVKMVFVLFIISAVTAGVVAAVNKLTKDKIADNLDAEIRNSFVSVFGEDVTFRELGDIPAGLETVYEINADGNTYYCASINSAGFGGNINILASFGKDGKIAGVSVVSNSETPGIGSRVMASSFTSLFAGKSSADDVDSITGATISSNALKAGIASAQKILAGAGLIGAESEG
jgi:electron transport complex protein RnfG